MITLFDIILLVIVLVSALLAMSRGLFREVFSLAAWAGAFAAAAAVIIYPDILVVHLEDYVDKPVVAQIGASVIAFFVTLLVLHLITMKLTSYLVEGILGPLDRSLGFVFGAVRGFFLVVIVMAFFWLLIPEEAMPDWVQNAKSKVLVQSTSEVVISWLPKNWEDTLRSLLGGEAEDDQAGST